jgi:hypothetical protein
MSRQLLIVLLRFGALMTGLAFLTVPLPVESMVSTHRWLGLGDLPQAPVVEYLARSVAAFYGFHGVLLFLLSTDVVRYAPIINYIAVMNVLLGLMLVAIDAHAGLPVWWIVSEGPPVVLTGIAIGLLNRAVARERLRRGENPTW